MIALLNTLVTRDGLTVIARLGDLPVLGQTDVTLEAPRTARVLGLRALALILCGALYAAAVDPDEVLRLFRRVSFRSALTATLATRMVPVLARDARRLAEAQRCRPGAPPSRAPRCVRADAAGVLDRALDVAAALEVRGYGARAAGPAGARGRGRVTTSRSPPGRAVIAALGRRRAGVAALGTVPRRIRRCARPWARGAPSLAAAALLAARAAPVRRPPGDRAVSVLALERRLVRLPGRARAGARRRRRWRSSPGELVVLAGASGRGKSTLLRAASGLVPHFHGGDVRGPRARRRDGHPRPRPRRAAAVAGTLFQDPETQVVMGTVRAELAFALENRGEAPAAVARGVEEAALALGIAHLLDRPTAELSGGELQRVALGAALAGRPQLVLLDEPTSQLDPVAGDELIALLRRLNEDWDAAILLAEHRLERCLGRRRPGASRCAAGASSATPSPREFLAWALRRGAGARDAGRAAALRPRAGAGGGASKAARAAPASARAAPGRRSDRGRRRGPRARSRPAPARRSVGARARPRLARARPRAGDPSRRRRSRSAPVSASR